MDEVAALRVAYSPNQHLGSREFQSEQSYHLAMRRRHNIAHHDWGIVRGLELGQPDTVEAGFAIDGYGRELILAQRQSLHADQGFYDLGGDVLDAWILYGRREANGVFVEQPWLQLSRGAEPGADRRHPPQVAPKDVSFDATRVPPDDPASLWPVYLGSIQRDPTDPKKKYTLVSTGRPYIGARAGSVAAPGSEARIELGQKFSVYVDDPEVPNPVIDCDPNDLSISGELDVDGDLAIGTGRLVFSRARSATGGAWRIDRVKASSTSNKQQLRIVMGSATSAEVVIGVWKEGKFQPCLTVHSNGDVNVAGNLLVGGTVTPNAGP